MKTFKFLHLTFNIKKNNILITYKISILLLIYRKLKNLETKMNIIYLSLFLFILFFQTYSVIPIWDFNSQSIDLFPSQDSSYSYTTYSNADVKLEKIFIRNNGVITYINKLTIGDKSTQVLFDDIESVYQNQLGCEILICPKGKFHPFDFFIIIEI